MKTIYVKNFSTTPGPRKEIIGPFSGERFREEVLLKEIRENPDEELSINLDGTAGYGSSFLEEAFGGLVRLGLPESKIMEIVNNLISQEDESLIDEIKEYVEDEIQNKKVGP